MAKIKTILKALDQALETNDFTDFISLVEEDPKCLKARFSADNITLLHKLCSINIPQLKLERDADDAPLAVDEETYSGMLNQFLEDWSDTSLLNAPDTHGNTPLHCAVEANNLVAVKLLAEYEDTDLNAVNHDAKTALTLARERGFNEIETFLLQESPDIPDEAATKEFQRQQKQNIINCGPLRQLSPGDKHYAHEAIEAVFYIEDDQLREQFNDSRILAAAEGNEILKPLIQMLGLSALRGNLPEVRRITLFKEVELLRNSPEQDELQDSALAILEKELGKKFKIICVDAINTFRINADNPDSRGLYTQKNSVFIAAQNLGLRDAFGVILHESAHFAMKQLFNNESLPYPKGENSLQEQFYQIIKDTYNNLYTYINDENEGNTELSEDEVKAFYSIIEIYKFYPEEEWAQELIVRIPQVMAILGPDKGAEWLNKYTPELMQFYMNEINPRITAYLSEHHAENYLRHTEPASGLIPYRPE